MQYILVKNKEQIFLGPIDWKPRFIQTEINELIEDGELSVDFTVPPVEQGYIDIGDGFEIFEIVDIISPDINTQYEDPVGPFYTYADNKATQVWQKQDKPLHAIQDSLKQVAATERYRKEILGTKVTIQNLEVFVSTDRSESRNILSQKFLLMSDTDTILWKFPEGWLTLTKSELGSIVSASSSYIQAQFDWEQTIITQINDAIDIETLKAIIIVEPVTIETIGVL